jgi:hypothetical protein
MFLISADVVAASDNFNVIVKIYSENGREDDQRGRSAFTREDTYKGKSIRKLQMDIELKQEYRFEKYFYFST